MTQYADQNAKASHVHMLAVTWTLFGVALSFFIARMTIRLKVSKKIFWDDGWAFFAIILLLANAAIITAMLKPMYITIQMQKFSASIKRQEPGVDIFASLVKFLKFQFGETLIFWTCLWAVKASFLAFFKRLTDNVKGHYLAWWIITVITGLAYIGCVITYPVSCSEFTPLGCTKPKNVRLALLSLRFSTSVDILTDLMIIALPISLACRVRLPWKPRLALLGVFSLGGIIVIFAIVRVVFTNSEHRQPEISWLNIWSAVEAGIACIVCNLAPFKILFRGRVRNYTSNAYRYGGRYARDGKATLESHEMSLSSRAGTAAKSKETGTLVSIIESPARSVGSSRSTQQAMRIPSMHLPKGSLLTTDICADQQINDDSFARKGVILVTEELDRKVTNADEIAVVHSNVEDSIPQSLRMAYIERHSEDSMERLPPSTPKITGVA